MAHTDFADRIKETTTTTGTGTINLDGAVSGYQTFVQGLGNGHYTYYCIFNSGLNEWEVGLGLVTDNTPDTLSRDTVLSSSNAGSLVNFSAGTKDVICTMPASKSVIIDGDSNISVTANLSATLFSGSGASLTSLNASNLASGTLPDARFPATLPAANGANLTGLNASNLASGTIPDARFPATIPASSGANLTNLNASNVSSGTLDNARLPSTISVSGNVTASRLLVEASAATLDLTSTSNIYSKINFGDAADTDIGLIYYDHPNNAMKFYTNNQEQLAISSAGDVTFTADANFGDLDSINMGPTGEFQIYHDHANGVSVVKDVDAGGSINVQADTISLTGATSVNGAYTLPTADGTSGQVITTDGLGALSFTTITGTTINNNADNRVITGSATANTLNGESGLTYDGSTLAVTGVVTETSSISYKENVKPLEFNDAIYSVNAVKYDFKDGSQKDEVGVIAEELYEVLPDLVSLKNGKPNAVKYTKLTMYLLEALKKQNKEIQELKAKLN